MMMNKGRMVFAAVVSIGLLCGHVSAQGQSQGRGRGHESTSSVVVVFRDADRTTFHDYFVEHEITAKALPPGIAKNVARGKPLPPGIAKRALPPELVALAPKVEKDVSFAIVGEVVVAIKGGVVIDVLTDIFK